MNTVESCPYTPEGCAEANRLVQAYKIDLPLNKRELEDGIQNLWAMTEIVYYADDPDDFRRSRIDQKLLENPPVSYAVSLVKKYRRIKTQLEWIGKCDVCGGDPSSVDDCACGGTGRMSDTIDYMRRIIFELQNKLDVANEMLIALGEEGDYWAGHCESCGVRKPIWSSSSRKGECDCGKEDGSDADDK